MPASITTHIHHFFIKVDGTLIPHQVMDNLLEVTVDSTLYLPTMFTLKFNDEKVKFSNTDHFRLGADVEILAAEREKDEKKVMSGEITAIEPEYHSDLTATLTIRGYDLGHRLTRGTKNRVFIQVTDSDIVNKIAGEAGLTPVVEATSIVYKHIFQDNVTDFAFLRQRAERIGYELYVDDKKLYFQPSKGKRGEITLEWGTTLRSFQSRLTLAGQVDQVVVKGWDIENKREIIGQATKSQNSPKNEITGAGGKFGGQLAQIAFEDSAKAIQIRYPVATQDEAQTLAQAILDDINATSFEAEGVAVGNPDLLAGKKVTIEKLGPRFSGTYFVSSAIHRYNQRGYEVEFKAEGSRPRLWTDFLSDVRTSSSTNSVQHWGGVVPAIVTNNNDPDELNRVKLKFPWLDDKLESDWARVVGLGAGNERGIYWLPEINDEVLVAFEHGDFNQPYVLAGLWNGVDKTPESVNKAVGSGKVFTHMLRTRTGHVIRFEESDSEKYIEIVDSAEGTTIKLDAQSRNLSIDTKQDISIKATGNVNLEATGIVTIKGAMIKLN